MRNALEQAEGIVIDSLPLTLDSVPDQSMILAAPGLYSGRVRLRGEFPQGVLVKSVATSNFSNAVAEGMGIDIVETPVGFKNFRPYMVPAAAPRAIVTFEASDEAPSFWVPDLNCAVVARRRQD